MIRVLIAGAIACLLSSCLTWQNNRVWDPATAVADAERDIARHEVRFCYIGGYVAQAPGLPSEALVEISRYPHIPVGPQGCIMNEHSAANAEYAARYNRRMWRYLSSQPKSSNHAMQPTARLRLASLLMTNNLSFQMNLASTSGG